MTTDERAEKPPPGEAPPSRKRSIYDKQSAPGSRLTPGPRRASPAGVDPNDRARLLAGVVRAAVGVLFVVVSTLFLPVHMITPIIGAMGVLMVVTGSTNTWSVGRGEPRLQPVARVLVWTFPTLLVAAFATMAIVGPGAFAPDFSELVSPPPSPEPMFVPQPPGK